MMTSIDVASNVERNMITENEAAANDIEMEEHLPESPDVNDEEELIRRI